MFPLESEKIGFKDTDWEDIDSCIWGLPPIAPYHTGYDHFLSAMEFLEEKGVKTEILFPRLHVQSLDNLDVRMQYYSTIFQESTSASLDINTGDFQLNQKYLNSLMKYSSRTRIKKIKKSLPETANSCFEAFLPLSQVLDPVHLDKDMVLAGAPQRRVYALGRDIWGPEEKKPIYFIQLAKDVNENNLKKSSLETRINLHDSREKIETKLRMKQDLEKLRSHSVDAPYEEVEKVEDLAEKLEKRFRNIERALERENLMRWLDRDKFN